MDEALSVFQWDEDRKKRLHAEQVRRANKAILEATRVIAD